MPERGMRSALVEVCGTSSHRTNPPRQNLPQVTGLSQYGVVVTTPPATSLAAELQALTGPQPVLTPQLLGQVHRGLLLIDVPRSAAPTVQVAPAQLPARSR